jgi:hypothetical protein
MIYSRPLLHKIVVPAKAGTHMWLWVAGRVFACPNDVGHAAAVADIEY